MGKDGTVVGAVKKARRKSSPSPFTGMVRCGLCGANYIRQYNHKVVWICLTYHRNGRNACPVKQISNDTLIEKTAKALGLNQLDERAVQQKIDYILIPQPFQLHFVLKDGSVVGDSWYQRRGVFVRTPKMREVLRQKRLQAKGRTVHRFYGYNYENGVYSIVSKEAAVVRRIFADCKGFPPRLSDGECSTLF